MQVGDPRSASYKVLLNRPFGGRAIEIRMKQYNTHFIVEQMSSNSDILSY